MKSLKLTGLFFYVTLTILMVYDHFPNTTLSRLIPKNWMVWFLIGLIVFSLIFNRDRDSNRRESVAEQVFSLVYFIGLFIVFTLLGGTSVSGLGLNSIGLWIAAAVTIWEIYKEHKGSKTK